MKKITLLLIILIAVLSVSAVSAQNGNIGINVLLNTNTTPEILTELQSYGRINEMILSINALTMRVKASDLPAIQALPYVAAANPDAERYSGPIDTVAAVDFSDGLSTWNLDAINVTDFGFDNRQVAFDGSGVYVAVLDTGLLHTWRQYFPQERIVEELARSFGGGGNEQGNVSTQPNKWEHDTNSHGTHVTSTIIGYSLGGTPVNGVAPLVNIIPVKVLNNNGSGWSSVVAAGISYIGSLKAPGGPLENAPVVINMSLGGPVLDAVEQAAIDYAIAQGVVIVASAGNEGTQGMGYPGAYAPVISVAASGWIGEWLAPTWWYQINVAEPTDPNQFYITDFSSRALAGQDLDVAAPGSWVVGPYQLNQGQTSYFFLGGTSMASPHVAGIVALMLQKNPAVTAAQAELILEGSAIPLPPDSRIISLPGGGTTTVSWGADATGSGLVTADGALAGTP